MSKLILGVISTLLAIISWFIFWWLSVLAIFIGIVGVLITVQITDDNSKSYDSLGKIFSIIGIVLGGIALLTFLISLAF